MTDDPSDPGPSPAAGNAGDGAHCPWCSAPLPGAAATACPSCGAHLVAPEGVAIPGVTELDAAAFVTGGAARAPRPALGISLGGDADDEPMSEEEHAAVATPDLEVRREMLRMELAAKLAELQREARLIEAERAEDAEAAPGAAIDGIPDAEPAAEAAPAAGAGAADPSPGPDAADATGHPPD